MVLVLSQFFFSFCSTTTDLEQIRQQLGGTEVEELVDSRSGDGGNGVIPKGDCHEATFWKGPCLELVCVAACLFKKKHGGHCTALLGKCRCFVC